MLECFSQVERGIVSPPVMQASKWELPFKVMCDASDCRIGPKEGHKPYAIYYASRTLDATQVNYATTDNEFLAIVFALEKFRSYTIAMLLLMVALWS